MGIQTKPAVTIGLLAHVDAGKTTASEALLYTAGALRTLGRVDHADAFLDTHSLERSRGITIFSKQARLQTPTAHITLVDTPGHVDFSTEAERVMPILDCALLVISGTDGVQAHTLTLWQLLQRYRVPTFLFINKMDLPGTDREALLAQLQEKLSPGCVDFGLDSWQENAALCDEALLESFLETGSITDGNVQGLIRERRLFPCCFGSALKLQGIDFLLQFLERFAPRQEWQPEFSARVYKISRDAQGNRLSWLRITGGSLKVREQICYVNQKGESLQEKAVQLRLYSGDKFTAAEVVEAGQLVAVTGLSATYAGQSLGAEPQGQNFALESVMTYRVNLPKGSDPALILPKLRLLEEEDPQLKLQYRGGQIHVQIMGKIQLEVFRALVKERFDLEITLDDRKIFYKETIEAPVEGVGHYEPLRHYAEVHVLLEPLPRGSGLVFDTACPTDVLEAGYQNLILTHMEEKVHRGVLTGSPITDMKLTLLVGKAHLKHTEGGDMRQATYRAIRQGLMQAKSILLEPWYNFHLTVPTELIGRAITDIRAMGGEFEAPEAVGKHSVLTGLVPAAELKDYADTLAAYTQGKGQLQLTLQGYLPCHDQAAVVENAGYDPEADLENTPDSVFCGHGAGFNVKWHQVKDYMHLESGLKQDKPAQILTHRLSTDDRELEKILEKHFGPQTTTLYRPSSKPATQEVTLRTPKKKYIIVDGYNVIFAWEQLAETARSDLEAARRQLLDALSSFAGFTKISLAVVFDGYKQKGNPGQRSQFHNIQVVYTREGETADAYIESLVHEIGGNYNIRVASSDALIQVSSLRSGVLRMSARELLEEVDRAKKEMAQHFGKK